MCLKSSNLPKEFLEGTRTTHITVHNTNTFRSHAQTHTHTHTHKKLNTEVQKWEIKILIYEYKQDS